MSLADALPAYRDLPLVEGLPLRHAWEVFGRDDDLGTLNLLDEETVLRGLAEARTGSRLSLSLPLQEPDPPLFGREPLEHELVQLDRNTWDDRLANLWPQGSSQWDGLRHVRCREHGFWTGVTADPADMGDRLGIDHWSAGVVSRGVLLDVPRFRAARGEPFDPLVGEEISAGELRAVSESQGVEIAPGDVLCVRTGWVEAWRGLTTGRRASMAAGGPDLAYAGLAGSEEVAEQLWDWHVAAVVCDNPSVEVRPGDPAQGSLHRRLIPLLGMALGELFALDEMAAACADQQRWTFTFLGIPSRVAGGLGSPANAVGVL